MTITSYNALVAGSTKHKLKGEAFMSWKKISVIAAVASLSLAGCSAATTDEGTAAGDNSDLTICVYTHGDGDHRSWRFGRLLGYRCFGS